MALWQAGREVAALRHLFRIYVSSLSKDIKNH
jgi:hypothetical protein